jgi:PAS domain S-box-containing protein
MRLRTFAVFAAGVALTLVGFVFSRDALNRQVEAQFHAAARDHSESVMLGLQHGFEDVAVFRSFFESSDEVSRSEFDAFSLPMLARHPYIQAFQWLPEVTPRHRAALEAEARRTYPGFRYFKLDGQGKAVDMPPGASFYAVQYLTPYRGNEVALGYCAETLPTRQETLARALRTGDLAASGRVRLIQEPGNQAGLLVMIPVRGKEGQPLGVVQGVFRAGDLIKKSMAFLEPQGLTVRLSQLDGQGRETLLHEEPSRLPAIGEARDEGLRLVRTFDLAGQRWAVSVVPAGGYFRLGTHRRAWIELAAGLLFSLVLAGYVGTILATKLKIRAEVEARTHELATETASHRRDAEALRKSEARFRLLVETMGEGLWLLDAEGKTTFVNRRMADMLGYDPAELQGRSLYDFMALEDIPQAQRNMAARLKGRRDQHDFRFLRKDGSDLWALVTGTPVIREDGGVDSVLGVVADITDRRNQEQAHLQSQKLESLGVLAGGIAHDFNNLLTAVLGNISLAQLCLPKLSPAWPYLENMERAVQRATALTRQMLAYSGKGRFVVGPLDLNQAVEEMSHLLSVSISKSVALRFQLQDGLPCLMAEGSQIQQVVMNLVTNASEAIGEAEGIVSIRTGFQVYGAAELARDYPGQPLEAGPYLTLEVADTGQGMSAEVQARIFEPFFTTKFTGRGLGLSAMQGIVRGHRGGIRVYSEVGKGTTFKLIFPAGEGGQCEERPIQPLDGWMASGSILVVDDEEGVRIVASELLQAMGFEVETAADGLEALARFKEAKVPFRAVLMDLTMPHMGGVETFRELRRLDPHCRVVLTSGYNEQEAIQEFLGKGLAGFVHKPFLLADLQQVMRAAVEGL